MRDAEALPAWFEGLFRAAFLALLGFALVAMPLAFAGLFRAVLVLPLSVVAGVVLFTVWGRDAEPRGRANGPAIAALLIVLASTAVNARYSSQHLLVDSDPGVYAVTAKYVADAGDLRVDTQPGVFGNDPALRYEGAGFYPTGPDDTLYPQFVHLLPLALAVGDWFGGLATMLRFNALLGGLGLLAFFAFAARVVRPWWAVLGTAALAAGVPHVYFSRDTFSEPLGLALVFGALALLWDAREAGPPVRRGLVTGLAFGAGCLARIDAFSYLIPLAMWLSYELVLLPSRPAEVRARVARLLPAVAAGATVTAVLGYADAKLFSPLYLRDLGPQVRLIFAGLAAVLLAGAIAFALRGVAMPVVRRLVARREVLATAAVVLLVALAGFAWFVRPSVETVTQVRPAEFVRAVEGLQRLEGVELHGQRTYAEESMRWLSWYLGPVALALGVGGLALALRRLLRGEAERWLPFLLVFGVMTAYYVYDPSISPIHVFASRRFLPVTLPGLLLLAAYALSLVRWRVAGLLGAAFVLGAPLYDLSRVPEVRNQVPLLAMVRRTCDALPPGSAVVMTQSVRLRLAVTVETVCDVPVAGAAGPVDYRALAARMDRPLYVLSGDPAEIPPELGPAELVFDAGLSRLEPTLTKEARTISPARQRLFAVRVTP